MARYAVRRSGKARGTKQETGGNNAKKGNNTIECLLYLRSVRDQFKDAELDLSHNDVAKRLEALEDRLVDHLAKERELRNGVGLLTVAVVGDFNSGKSTFINALLGAKLCPVGEEPTTASVTYFIHGNKQRFELDRDGGRMSIEKREYLSMVRHGKVGDTAANIFHVSVDSPVLEHVRLVDTPGFNAPPPNNNDTQVTENAVTTADALFVIMDVSEGNPSKTLLEQLDRMRNSRQKESGPPAFLLLNKAELRPPGYRNDIKSKCEQYDEQFRNVIVVSAKQLNDTDEVAPFDSLETTTRRIRDALSRREPFDARISAKAVTERGQATYRVDIDGNVYQASVSPDGGLASREQLVAMVRSVAAERHTLLARQFRRSSSQLRTDWLKIVSALDGLCKRAARTSAAVGDPADERATDALNAIDDAKKLILDKAGSVFCEVAEEAVSKRQWPGVFQQTFYEVTVRPREAQDVVNNHDYWGQIETIVRSLTDLLKRLDVGIIPDPDRIAAELRERGADIVRETLESDCRTFEESEYWEPHAGSSWRHASKDESARDDRYVKLALAYMSNADEWTLDFSQLLQLKIDNLQETVIRYEEKGQAALLEQEDELTKLRDRINKLKEYCP